MKISKELYDKISKVIQNCEIKDITKTTSNDSEWYTIILRENTNCYNATLTPTISIFNDGNVILEINSYNSPFKMDWEDQHFSCDRHLFNKIKYKYQKNNSKEFTCFGDILDEYIRKGIV